MSQSKTIVYQVYLVADLTVKLLLKKKKKKKNREKVKREKPSGTANIKQVRLYYFTKENR